MKKSKLEKAIILLFFITTICTSSYFSIRKNFEPNDEKNNTIISYDISNIPSYNGKIYITINNNNPNFLEKDIAIERDYYSDLVDNKVRNCYDKD